MSRLDMTDLHGRWFDVLSSLGISKDMLTGEHCPCPVCGGHDRFRWDNKEGRGTWFCSKCGAGDGAQLAMNFLGCDFRALRAKIEPLLPQSKVRKSDAKRPMTPEERSAMLNKLWGEGDWPIPPDGPVGQYLLARLGAIPETQELRAAVYGTYALMLARVRDTAGKPCSIHRTYLTMEGKKLARKMVAGDLPKGCAVRLCEPTDVIGIAEGIETALSCFALDGVPTWAAMNNQLMEMWIPPEGLRIVVFGDRDRRYAGQKSAYVLAERLARDKMRAVEVRLPVSDDSDFNDVHQCRIGESANGRQFEQGPVDRSPGTESGDSPHAERGPDCELDGSHV